MPHGTLQRALDKELLFGFAIQLPTVEDKTITLYHGLGLIQDQVRLTRIARWTDLNQKTVLGETADLTLPSLVAVLITCPVRYVTPSGFAFWSMQTIALPLADNRRAV